jgi:tRNA/tmRNA/rRNA uracil-C5-methylase (TrmA/RlmC/RlmD family)
MAAEGAALGVDLSAEAIARARELAQAEGIRNVTFEHADAQIHLPFGAFRPRHQQVRDDVLP